MKMKNWYFTFGPSHVLSGGTVRDDGAPGLPLAGFYVAVTAASGGDARARMTEALGVRFAAVYPDEEGAGVILRRHLAPLLGQAAIAAVDALPLCECRTPKHPHGPGAHALDPS